LFCFQIRIQIRSSHLTTDKIFRLGLDPFCPTSAISHLSKECHLLLFVCLFSWEMAFQDHNLVCLLSLFLSISSGDSCFLSGLQGNRHVETCTLIIQLTSSFIHLSLFFSTLRNLFLNSIGMMTN
jgi:hypothetical protein